MATDEWLFDSIVQFLRSPLWRNPIQTYIDENCLTFEGAEENALEHTSIHEGFKNLVDQQLGDHLKELGVSPESFIAACENGQNKELNSLVMEYILALEDFPTFKKMMDKRNVELELAAMQQLKLTGCVPTEAPEEDVTAARRKQEEEENAMFEAAVANSIRDDDIQNKQVEMEEAQLEHALAISLVLEKERVRKAEEETERLAREDAARAEEERRKIEEEHKKAVEDLEKSFQEAKEQKEAEKVPEPAPEPVAAPEAAAPVEAAPEVVPEPPAPEPEAPQVEPPKPTPEPEAPKPAPAAEPAAAPKADVVPPEETLVTATPPPPKALGPPVLGPVSTAQTPTLGNVRLHRLSPFGEKSALPSIPKVVPKPAAVVEVAAPKPATGPQRAKPSEDDIQKRQEFLKAQRAKLLANNKAVREKEMQEYNEKKEREQAARAAAEAAPAGEQLDETRKQMRIALGQRFKEDLIAETRQAAARANAER